jgi:hypothetical protein
METRSKEKRTGRGTRGEPFRQNRELKKKKIIRFCREHGIDLVGSAPVDPRRADGKGR